MAGEVDFNYFLNRKYAILQQQADAGSQQANATTTNAATAALTGKAAANLDNTRAGLLPAESAAQIALQRAQTALTGNQAQVVVPVAQAQIRGLDATTALTGTQNRIAIREGLVERGPGAFGSVPMGASTPSMFRFSEEPLSDTKPLRRGDESGVRYMDRTGWGPSWGAYR